MIPYMGCEHARELLDGFLDGELSVDEQVAVESHLRWCRTCRLRIEDMRLIGASLRLRAAAPHRTDDQDLAAITAGTLMRVRAENAVSLAARIRELFVDGRLLWPALGATTAVATCVIIAGAMLQASREERPRSLAAMIETLSDRGSERNPLRPDGGNTIPRVLGVDGGEALAGIPNAEGVFWLHAVIGRDGRVANFDLVRTDHAGRSESVGNHDEHVAAVLDVVRQSRFSPAQTPLGRAVAVNVGWLVVVTTAEKEQMESILPPAVDAVVAAPPARIQPAEARPTEPAPDRRSAAPADLPIA